MRGREEHRLALCERDAGVQPYALGDAAQRDRQHAAAPRRAPDAGARHACAAAGGGGGVTAGGGGAGGLGIAGAGVDDRAEPGGAERGARVEMPVVRRREQVLHAGVGRQRGGVGTQRHEDAGGERRGLRRAVAAAERLAGRGDLVDLAAGGVERQACRGGESRRRRRAGRRRRRRRRRAGWRAGAGPPGRCPRPP